MNRSSYLDCPEDNANLLDPRYGDADNLKGFKFMGSGYSKVYSHMIKDFPMYDSRVACALTSLIPHFPYQPLQGVS